MKNESRHGASGGAVGEVSEARREALLKLGRFAKFAAPAVLGLVAVGTAGSRARAQEPTGCSGTGPDQTGPDCTGN
jgi:hypothetical protein